MITRQPPPVTRQGDDFFKIIFTLQVLEIHQKYDALKEELLKLRQESREEISSFNDIQLEAVRNELTTLIAKIEADDSNTNVVSEIPCSKTNQLYTVRSI